MLDTNLAALYGVPTKALNQAVRRNIERFPVDFMFQLTPTELQNWKSQIVTSNRVKMGLRKRPLAFTELGVAMLSSVLNSRHAIQVNIAIMRAFVKLRHAILAHQGIARRVEKLEGKVDVHETDIRLLVQDVEKLKKPSGPSGPINPSIL
jgi:hypothetical protein